MSSTTILDHGQISTKLQRLAWQICEHHHAEEQVILAGIEGNGMVMAERLRTILDSIEGPPVTLARVSLNKEEPLSGEITCDLPASAWENKVVVVVDDVLNSGRTLIYAVQYFLSKRVKKIRTVVLVDRSHRAFPVKADFVGLSLATTLQEHIRVEFGEKDIAYLM